MRGFCFLASVAMIVLMPSLSSAQSDTAAYEIYANSLTQLARLCDMQQRLGDRRWVRRIWIMPEASSIDAKPGVAGNVTNYKVEDNRIRAGVELPSGEKIAQGFASFGLNGWLGTAETDILAPETHTQIKSDAHALAVTAGWFAPKGVYLDTQLQYAAFKSNLSGEAMRLANNHKADALSTSLETGYRFFSQNFELTPRAQLIWTDIDFEDFPGSARVELKDGKTLSGLFGVFLERSWKAEGAPVNGRFHAEISARVPLDGKTAVSLGSTTLSSEFEDTALHFGFGAAWRWKNGTALFGAFSTEHGSESEFYRTSLGGSLGF